MSIYLFIYEQLLCNKQDNVQSAGHYCEINPRQDNARYLHQLITPPGLISQ